MKDEGRICQSPSNLKPVSKVLPHTVAAERKHRHWIPPNLTNSASCGCGRFGGHGCADVHAMAPVKSPEHQRHRIAPTATENDRANRNAFPFFYLRIQRWIIPHRDSKTAIRMRCLLIRCRRPTFPFPIETGGWWAILTLPPN